MKGLGLATAFGLALALLSVYGSPVRAQAVPTATIVLPEPGDSEQLYPGCNNIALTFPDGTPAATIVQAVTPAQLVQSMWRYDASTRRFEGFSPAAAEVSDLQAVDFLDAVWLCLAEGPGGDEGLLVPTMLSCLGPPYTVFPEDYVIIQATLRSEGGAFLPGRQILWSDGLEIGVVMPPASLTDESGVASTQYVFPFDVGDEWDEVVTATFGGDGTYALSSCEVTVHAVSPGLPTPPPAE